MSVRAAYRIDDVQLCIFELLNDNTDAPFDRCDIILGYPNEERFEQFTSPIIYVMPPIILPDGIRSQGGVSSKRLEISIGTWVDQSHGGSGESNVINSAIIDLFDDPQKCHSTQTFTVTLGLTAYTDTNLSTMGIEVEEIMYIRELAKSVDLKEFRYEINLQLLTN